MLRRLLAEMLGSMVLAAAVIGSGIMGERLAAGNQAVALLANTGATVAALAVLVELFAAVSGAHFNPAVSLIQAFRRTMPWSEAGGYALVQVVGSGPNPGGRGPGGAAQGRCPHSDRPGCP